MSEISHKYDITKADIRTSDGRTAKIIPSREYWALVARAEKAEAEVDKLTRLLARAYMFADWQSAEIDGILDAFEAKLRKDGEADA